MLLVLLKWRKRKKKYFLWDALSLKVLYEDMPLQKLFLSAFLNASYQKIQTSAIRKKNKFLKKWIAFHSCYLNTFLQRKVESAIFKKKAWQWSHICGARALPEELPGLLGCCPWQLLCPVLPAAAQPGTESTSTALTHTHTALPHSSRIHL